MMFQLFILATELMVAMVMLMPMIFTLDLLVNGQVSWEQEISLVPAPQTIFPNGQVEHP